MGKPNVKKMEAEKDVEGLIRKINFGYRGCSDVCKALGEIGGERAIKSLTEVMSDDIRGKKDLIGLMEVSVGMAAIYAIRRIGEPAVEPLIRILEVESRKANPIPTSDMTIKERLAACASASDKMAVGAANALVKIGEPATEPLTKALDDKNEKVRKRAKEILEKIQKR